MEGTEVLELEPTGMEPEEATTPLSDKLSDFVTLISKELSQAILPLPLTPAVVPAAGHDETERRSARIASRPNAGLSSGLAA